MKKMVVFTVLISLGMVNFASAASMVVGETWDVRNDIVFQHVAPLGDNPNGQWTYGSTPSPTDRNAPDTTTFLPFDKSINEAGTGVPWWHYYPAWVAVIPAVWLNTTAGSVYGSVPDKIGMHPGYAYEPTHTNYMVVIRWEAPGEGDIVIDGLWSAMGAAALRDLYVIKNNTDVLQIILDDNGSVANPIDITQSVVTGDIFDFMVGGGSDGYGGGDSESLDLIITVIPEPVTMMLLGLGSVALLRRRK